MYVPSSPIFRSGLVAAHFLSLRDLRLDHVRIGHVDNGEFRLVAGRIDVRRQSFWDSELVHLREALARLVGDVMRPADDAASVDW